MAATAEDRPDSPAERLGRLFDDHHGRLYRLARRMSRNADDARDLVQDTFVRVARYPSKVPCGMPHEEAWLVRVMINICRDRWRQRATRARLDAGENPLPTLAAPSPEAALVARALVQFALGQLPPKRRAVLVMYELEGMTIAAIARSLGVTAVTVRWHLSRGRLEMARSLRAHERPVVRA